MNILEKIALTKIKGIGPKLSRTLLAYNSSVDEIFRSSKKQLLSIPNIWEIIAKSIISRFYLKDAEEGYNFVQKHDIEIAWIEDSNYPKRLRNCEDAPLLLYFKGNISLNPSRVIGIVGARNATSHGKRICEEFIQQLKENNVQIIIVLAYGLDSLEHRESLKNQIPTIGVLGHGQDRIYPATHRELASRMLEKGGLLIEFPSGINPRQNFPMRNRIMAGLADVTILVEAEQKGGVLITAEIAYTYNRDVCAFPNRIDQEYFVGCNYLIKSHRAHIIRHVDDLSYLMNWNKDDSKPTSRKLNLLTVDMTKDGTKVYEYIKEQEQTTIGEIALYCDWPQSKLAIVHLEMEMKNILTSLPGKTYKLI